MKTVIFRSLMVTGIAAAMAACAPESSSPKNPAPQELGGTGTGTLKMSAEAPVISTFDVEEKPGTAGGPSSLRNLKIRDVTVKFDSLKILLKKSEKGAWVVFPDKNGSLSLYGNNGSLDLANLEIPRGVSIHQMRFMLGGEDNFVTFTDGTKCQLRTPSAGHSGLKFHLASPLTIEGGKSYHLKLKWDVEKSVVLTGNGDCILKPVIRASVEHDEDGDSSDDGEHHGDCQGHHDMDDDSDSDDGTTTTTTTVAPAPTTTQAPVATTTTIVPTTTTTTTEVPVVTTTTQAPSVTDPTTTSTTIVEVMYGAIEPSGVYLFFTP